MCACVCERERGSKDSKLKRIGLAVRYNKLALLAIANLLFLIHCQIDFEQEKFYCSAEPLTKIDPTRRLDIHAEEIPRVRNNAEQPYSTNEEQNTITSKAKFGNANTKQCT